jgi:hypothetical protein
MLSGKALDLAYELRDIAGPLIQGGGPPMAELCARTRLTHDELRSALKELEDVRFIAIDPSQTEPEILVLAPMQIYLDDLENQGGDDL